MALKVEEFNPPCPRVNINGFLLSVGMLTLQRETIITKKFGSIEACFGFLNDNPEKIHEVIWEFVDQSFFNFNINSFLAVFTEALDPVSVGKDLVKALHEVISKSNPIIKNIERHKVINKINESKTNEAPCYAVYYDRLAKRYGYSIQDFYNLTLSQVHALLKVADDESYKELEVQAALADKKLKERIKVEDIEPEEEKQQEDHAQEALKKLQEAYKHNKAKEGK